METAALERKSLDLDRMVFQSVGYVKGMSRACMMLMLLHVILEDIESMHEIFTTFYESVRKSTSTWLAQCTELMTRALEQEDDDLGVVFMPTFVWKIGRLYAQEISILKARGESRLCLDRKFSLTFESKPDSRDLRPCSYEGRFRHQCEVPC